VQRVLWKAWAVVTGEFRFQCPACGQHIQAEARDAGTQVKCPTCQADIVVPDPATVPTLSVSNGRFSVPVPLHARAAPRAPGFEPPPPPPPPMCRLAVVSLILSLSSLILWPFGFIPAIILGRKAKLQIKEDPKLRGLGLAKAGLAIGYGFAAVFGVAAVAGAIWSYNAYREAAKQAKASAPSGAPVKQAETNLSPGVEPSLATSGWTLNVTNMIIPTWKAAGRICGREFKYERANVDTNRLSLRQGGTNYPQALEAVVYFRLKPREILVGRKFEAGPEQSEDVPRVQIRWRDEQNAQKSQSFTNGFVLKLEFGNVTSGRFAGTIYLCVPDADKSFVAGTFNASIRRPSAPKTPRAPPSPKPR
jgi:hypothetical protein